MYFPFLVLPLPPNVIHRIWGYSDCKSGLRRKEVGRCLQGVGRKHFYFF